MYCPMCGADVPESKFCENCGSPLHVGAASEASVTWKQPDQALDFSQSPYTSEGAKTVQTPEINGASYAGERQDAAQVSGTGSGTYAEKASFAGVAPSTAFVLAIIGLVLGLLGFSLVTIIPGIICCIIGLVLNSRYTKSGQYNQHKTETTVLGVIGLILGALSIVFFVALGAASVWFVGEYGDEIDDADIEEIVESFDSEEGSTSGSAGSVDSSLASMASVDSRAFDKRSNVTIYALTELSGEEITDALKTRGYVWEESARAWMASSGATFEIQDDGGVMSQDGIERLGVGAQGDSVAYAALTVGYETPAAALDALSENVKLKGTCADSEGAIVFAIVEGSDGDERLAAISETGKKQQMVFLFTEEAIESGLFSEITGVNCGKSIESVWKALNGK